MSRKHSFSLLLQCEESSWGLESTSSFTGMGPASGSPSEASAHGQEWASVIPRFLHGLAWRFALVWFGVAWPVGGQVYDWTNFAGYPHHLTNEAARNQFERPMDVAVDGQGGLYVVDASRFQILKILSSGAVQVLAGGTQGSQDGVGSAAQFHSPYGIAVDGQGNLYVADNHTVRKVTPQGATTTVAGVPGASGSANGTGAEARFGSLVGIAVTSTGTIYLPDPWNHTIRKISPQGVVTTFAGKPGVSGSHSQDGPTLFKQPTDVTLDSEGNLYVADAGNDAIRKLTPGGADTLVYSWDSTNWKVHPMHLTWSSSGLYVTDVDQCTLHRFEITQGSIYAHGVVAGVRGRHGTANGFAGTSRFYAPKGVAADASGAVYIADELNRTIRRFRFGELTTHAGSVGSRGSADGQGSAARFFRPSSLAIASDASLYVLDSGNSSIRKITPEGLVSTHAGLVGIYLYITSEDQPYNVSGTSDILFSRSGELLGAWPTYNAIIRIHPNGQVARIGLTDVKPAAMAETVDGGFVLSDINTDSVFRVGETWSSRSLIAGGLQGDRDGQGAAARLNRPRGLCQDATGNLYVADMDNHKIRKITPEGQVTTFMGPQDGLSAPEDVIADDEGNIYVADTGNHVIRVKRASGAVATLGGTTGIFGGQNGRALKAGFWHPNALAMGPDGVLYVADRSNHRIMRGRPLAATTPALEVRDAANGTVADDALLDLGTQTNVFPPTHSFKVRNAGSTTLTFTGTPRIHVQPLQAPFYASHNLPDNLKPGEERTFHIHSAINGPTGIHEAEVVIATDDPGRPFASFRVRAEVVSPAYLSFEAAKYVTHQGETELVIPVHRSGRTTPFSVTVQTTALAATSVPPFARAVAGVDFQPLSLNLDFAEGEMTKLVPVRLLPRSGAGLPHHHFGLTLASPTDGNALKYPWTTEIQVLAEDGQAPSLALTSPSSRATHVLMPILITGVAGDTMGLDRVIVSLNQNSPVKATLFPATTPTAVPFQALIYGDALPVSVLTLKAYDLKNNVTVLTRTLKRLFPVHLQRRFTPDVPAAERGPSTFKISSFTKGWGSTSSAAGVPVVTAGSHITLSTTIPKGYLLDHWENVPEGARTAAQTLSFTVPDDGVPRITAVFSPNPFVNEGPLNAGGGNLAYQGLIQPIGETVRSNATFGHLAATLVPTKASLSGRLQMNGGTHAFSASLTGDGRIWFKSGKTWVEELDLAGLRLRMNWSEDGLQTSVRGQDEGLSEGLARSAHFHKARPVPAALLNRSATQGYYTLVWPAQAQASGRHASTHPQGASYAAFSLTHQGKVVLAGVLADGTTFTASHVFHPVSHISLYVQLPTPGESAKRRDGSFSGTLTLTEAGIVGGDDCHWFRPAVVESAKPVTQLYTDGWPDGLQLQAVGSAFHPGIPMQQVLSASSGALRLSFADGRLVSPIDMFHLTISANKIVQADRHDKSATLKISSSSGIFSGSFEPNWEQPQKKGPTFRGILVQGLKPAGLGFFISNVMADIDPEAGGVSLSGID